MPLMAGSSATNNPVWDTSASPTSLPNALQSDLPEPDERSSLEAEATLSPANAGTSLVQETDRGPRCETANVVNAQKDSLDGTCKQDNIAAIRQILDAAGKVAARSSVTQEVGAGVLKASEAAAKGGFSQGKSTLCKRVILANKYGNSVASDGVASE